MKIAFRNQGTVGDWVFCLGDMSHLFKKVVNAMDRSFQSGEYSGTKLKYDGADFSLDTIRDIWMKLDNNGLRKWRFSMNHFNKDGFSRMCVYLAVQVLSESTCEMIDLYVQIDDEPTEMREKAAKLVPMIKAADQMVDIMNGSSTGKRHGMRKVGRVLNKPLHENLKLLASHFTTFANWKKNAADPAECVPATTSEDMAFMVLGLIGVCRVYLAEDGSRILHPRNAQEDVCEHAFSSLKSRSAGLSAISGNQGIAQASGMSLSGFNANNSREYSMRELNAPLPKLPRRNT
jgi:hypothetical protein